MPGRLPAIAVLVAIVPAGVRADGEFFRIDRSSTATTAVASIGRDRLTYGATLVDGAEDSSLALRVTLAVPAGDVTVKAGPDLVVDLGDRSAEVGLVVSAERWTATDFGSFYWLAEARTIDRSVFATAQFGFANGFDLEISHGRSTEYEETSVALGRRLGDGPWSVLVGYRFDSEEIFAGLRFNSY